MQLAIDVGNSNIFGGFYNDDLKMVDSFRFKTKDDIYIRLKKLDIKPNKIGISSVVPQANNTLVNACLEILKVEPTFVSFFSKHGLNIKIDNAEMMGADLIAGASAAVSLYPEENILLVDLGTATTISVITKNKEFLGGHIFTGLGSSLKSLSVHTSLLGEIEFDKTKIRVIGNETKSAMISGSFYAQLGAVKEITKRIKREFFNAPAIVIGTGGFAPYFRDLNAFDVICENLVTDGIIKMINA